jgi:hypothetical protein
VPVFPFTCSFQDDVPRRAVTAKRGIAGAVLEAERVLRALGGVDERGARRGLRIAGILLVARHDDDHVQVVEDAGRLERLERRRR